MVGSLGPAPSPFGVKDRYAVSPHSLPEIFGGPPPICPESDWVRASNASNNTCGPLVVDDGAAPSRRSNLELSQAYKT